MSSQSNRWFNSSNTMLSASERSNEKRKQTIYNEIQKNIQQLNTANPIKKNGTTYNRNAKINPACDASANNIEFASSYDMLRNITQGAELLHPVTVHIDATKYESSCVGNPSNRCFTSFNPSVSSGECSSEKRQKTIYTEILKNVQQLNNANPVKKNGEVYNRNAKINTTCDISSGYVEAASSYDMLRDITQGADLIYPNLVSTQKYESWCGILYSANYEKYNTGTLVNTSGTDVSTNIVIDPNHVLFYNTCRPEQWTRVVDLSFQETFFAQQANIAINTYAS